MKKDRSMLTISEMSSICRISRQTLIYYDKNDIFKPVFVQENGYRYYSIYQVPYLREICSLKDNYFSLKDIVENFEGRTIQSTKNLLTEKKDILQNEVEELKKRMRSIDDRLRFLDRAEVELARAGMPYIAHLPACRTLFRPWSEDGDIGPESDRSTMHFTHMALRNQLEDLNLKTNDYGWGAMIPFSSIKKGMPLEGAGGYVNLPKNFINTTGASTDNMLSFPESDYACLGRYGMPYETQDLYRLLDWIKTQGYRLTGNVLDECLLDTTYYTDEIKKDFCLLMAPVEKIAES